MDQIPFSPPLPPLPTPHHPTPPPPPLPMSTLLVLLLLLPLPFATTTTTAIASEADLLLSFKYTINDPTGSLSSWSRTTPLCSWGGIACSPNTPTVTSLDLQHSNLSGELPTSLCHLPHLTHLNLAHNHFNQPLPLRLSLCTSLLSLNLSTNLLWGTLPTQLSLLTSLLILDLSRNRIEGTIPSSFSSLGNLQVLNLGSNLLTGALHPSALANLTNLLHLDLSMNPLMASELPPEVGGLKKLGRLLLQSSGLYGGIPESFLGLRDLVVLDLSRNNLTGKVPLGFGLGLSKLSSLDLSGNRLHGSFPSQVCSGEKLKDLKLHGNLFTGIIPPSLGDCLSLEVLQVQNNGFSGELPHKLWSLPTITIIRVESNRFNGAIPDSIRLAPRLEQLQIDNNSFIGRIPRGLGMVSTMYRFSASLNGFYGVLPVGFCDSPSMSILNLSFNRLSGSIPELRNCGKLVSLSLASNKFTGEIPKSLARLPVLTYIDLSSNHLTGGIPQGLENLKLALFNVSYNQLSGEVPASLISGLPASFLQGNSGLCGPGLPNSCNQEKSSTRGKRASGVMFVLVSLALGAGMMLLAAGLYVKHRSSQFKERSTVWRSMFYYPLGITGEELEARLSEKNTVASGAFGKVHVVQLPRGETVAVKRIMNSGSLSLRSLRSEIRILAKARHKNIAKILGFCYSEDSTLLIYECLPKGSLGDMICQSDFSLEWSLRLQIALGVSQGLSYLHNDYVLRLLHRNMKSNNILLDDDYRPKLTDFALDHVVGESSFQASMNFELGSHCYLAPEHGYIKKPTEQMDVYGFGIVLLELITGRPAEQPDSRESLDIIKWVRRKVNTENGALLVLDPKISQSHQQAMLVALDIALSCTSVLPEKRPTMLKVVRLLQSLSTRSCPPTTNSSGESSTSCYH